MHTYYYSYCKIKKCINILAFCVKYNDVCKRNKNVLDAENLAEQN